jgi:hypothetical protein
VVSVNDGADQAFTVTPDAGYHVADVLVDGSGVGPATSYTFQNVTSDHTVAATVNHLPTVTSIAPDNARKGLNPAPVTISGTNFVSGATVKLSKANQAPISATVDSLTSTAITCHFDLTGAAVGKWSAVVTNPDNGTETLTDGFTVNPLPTVTSITPRAAGTGSACSPRIVGTNFVTGATVKLARTGRTPIIATVDSLTSTAITCHFDLTGTATGAWDVVVTNRDGGFGTLAGGFTVNPRPGVATITPNSAATVSVCSAKLVGTNFATGVTVRLTRTGSTDIAATGVTRVSATAITCKFTFTGAPVGKWSVVVTNSDGGFGMLTDGFTVNPLPTVISITPDEAGTGVNPAHVTISGTNFVSGATVKLTRTGSTAKTATNVAVSASAITCDFNLTVAATGAWNAVVTNTDGGIGTLTNGFKVNAHPVVDSITPNNARTGTRAVSVKLSGHNYVQGATVKLTRTGQPDIEATNVQVLISTTLTFNLDLTGTAIGKWSVVVTNPDKGRNDGIGFTVNP